MRNGGYIAIDRRVSDRGVLDLGDHDLERRNNRLPVDTILDADASAFLNAAAIIDSTMTGAVRQLVTDLKFTGLWAKLKAVWPMVGGTEDTHKLNLKDPRDLDAAYRLTFHGGWTHDATGATPNGSTGYADTHVNASVVLSPVAGAIGFYSRTAGATAGQPYDMGCDDGDANPLIVIARYNNENSYLCYGDDSDSFSPNGPSGGDGRGFWVASRVGSTTTIGYHNGTPIASANVPVHLPNRNVYLGANNRAGVATYWSAKQHAFDFVAGALDGGEHSDLSVIVQSYQSALGRSV